MALRPVIIAKYLEFTQRNDKLGLVRTIGNLIINEWKLEYTRIIPALELVDRVVNKKSLLLSYFIYIAF